MKNQTLFACAVLFLITAFAFMPKPATEAIPATAVEEVNTETTTVAEEDAGPPCLCQYSVWGVTPSGINTLVIKNSSGAVVKSFTAIGNHSDYFYISAPYTYGVYWEALGGSANILMDCCNRPCKSASVSVPLGGGQVGAFKYSTSGCTSSCNTWCF